MENVLVIFGVKDGLFRTFDSNGEIISEIFFG
jgi:hypothetical protein